jgi:N-acetylglucosaminyldiphosphoundecaprenol N-acetyl-beta-D-mannosaminyltransferase
MIEKISNLGFVKTVELIETGRAGVVLCCTLNEIMMANEDRVVREAMKRADVLTPDGMPLVWYLRWKNGSGERVYGPDIMRELVDNRQLKHFFIGDDKNKKYFEKRGEYLVLPFKNEFSDEDYKAVVKMVKRSSPDIVWVGMGARKQVLMADRLKCLGVNSSIVTVGAGFDFLSGNKRQAPRWVRKMGWEWLFRMMSEPRRLTGRYIRVIVFGIDKFLTRLVADIRNKWFD